MKNITKSEKIKQLKAQKQAIIQKEKEKERKAKIRRAKKKAHKRK